jgi:NAD(P)-dependent dehydrogenase (short-subunit alcohol dehydrogenase family)
MKNKDRFAGRVAAITGAASGIGRALSLELARRGCEVALSDVDETGLAETAAMARGAHVTTKKLDVSDRGAVHAWADDVVKEHGRVNFVFNNAGIGYGATVQGAEEEELERIVDVDFWGVVYGTRAFLPHLEAARDGHVINISSVFGLIAFPGQCAYNAAKFAVRGFTEALRIELEMMGSPVSATCVHPGGIKTNIARTSKTHASIASLGFDPEDAKQQFEKSFRVEPEDAANVILAGVQKNARRVLIGTDARMIDTIQRLLPGSYHPLVAKLASRQMRKQSRKPARP